MFDVKKDALKKAKGSYERYKARIPWFTYKGRKPFGIVCHHFFWVLHNCVAHPLLGISPRRQFLFFHELTSHWLNCEGYIGDHTAYKKDVNGHIRKDKNGFFYPEDIFYMSSAHLVWKQPVIKNMYTWRVHNCISHMLIGMFPHPIIFSYHDKTAKEMNVEGWV